ncbi:MAG: hypothetical protein Q8O53_00745 [Candidatus Moranbacteria bacterium]|nr:hypothetical protein [Candidatus Moranbacteria bacterium]
MVRRHGNVRQSRILNELKGYPAFRQESQLAALQAHMAATEGVAETQPQTMTINQEKK